MDIYKTYDYGGHPSLGLTVVSISDTHYGCMSTSGQVDYHERHDNI